jgi:hypothetical protein
MENYTRSVTMRTVHNTVRLIITRTTRKRKNKSDIEKINFKGRNHLEVLKVSQLSNGRIMLNTEVREQDNESQI